jgi:uncharacterized damage-inducible protein DinB
MTVTDALLDSWTRQCQAQVNLLSQFAKEDMDAKPAEDAWTVSYHYAHLVNTRIYWLKIASGIEKWELPRLYFAVGEDWDWKRDPDEIRAALEASGRAVHDWVSGAIENGTQKAGNYDHPVFYLQHMIWHEGYHFGVLMQALRVVGKEPSDEWESAHVWDLWRQPD